MRKIFLLLFLSASLFADIFETSLDLLQSNLKSAEVPGAVMASPQKQNPDYYFHWIRDAALTTDLIVRLYISEKNPQKKLEYRNWLKSAAEFSQKLQSVKNRSGGLGEPKFHMDGTEFKKDWGRPQNDGAALRALAFSRWALELKKENDEATLKLLLPMIEADLKYVAAHYLDKNFDLWEEVEGQHFFTLTAQKRAFEMAHSLFTGNPFKEEIESIDVLLGGHWDKTRGVLVPTRKPSKTRDSGLDTSIILAANMTPNSQEEFGAADSYVLSTVDRLVTEFTKIYKINHQFEGVAMGRYPEDVYDGSGTDKPNGGNPWFLLTAALGEYYFKLHNIYKKRGSVEIDKTNLIFFENLLGKKIKLGKGDIFLEVLNKLKIAAKNQVKRLEKHSANGRMSEQFSRDNGFMLSAKDLTWSYASVLLMRLEELEIH